MALQPEATVESFAPEFNKLLEDLHPISLARAMVVDDTAPQSAATGLWTRLVDDGWLDVGSLDMRELVQPELLSMAEAAGRVALSLPFAFSALLLPRVRELHPGVPAAPWPGHAMATGRIEFGARANDMLFDDYGPTASYYLIRIDADSIIASEVRVESGDRVAGLDAAIPIAAVPRDAGRLVDETRLELNGLPAADLLRAWLVFEYGQMIGCAAAALELAIAHACERRQFGRAIGEFQAVKHALADAWIAVDNGRHALRALLALPAADPALIGLIGRCERIVAPSCRRAGRLVVQVHGGLGFAWEHDAHVYLKRIYRSAAQLEPVVAGLASHAASSSRSH